MKKLLLLMAFVGAAVAAFAQKDLTEYEISLYPNPVTVENGNKVHVLVPSSIPHYIYYIRKASNLQVMLIDGWVSDGTDVSSLPVGTYLINVKKNISPSSQFVFIKESPQRVVRIVNGKEMHYLKFEKR